MTKGLGEVKGVRGWCWKRTAEALVGLAAFLVVLACAPKPAGMKIATLDER